MHPCLRFWLHPATGLAIFCVPVLLFVATWFLYTLYIAANPIFAASVAMFGVTIFFGISLFAVSFLSFCKRRLELLGKKSKLTLVIFRVAIVIGTLLLSSLAISVIAFTFKPRLWPVMDVEVSEIGAVNTTSAKLWFRTNKYQSLVVRYKRVQSQAQHLSTAPVMIDPSRDYTANVVLSGLLPGTSYTFYTALYDEQGREFVWPERYFNTSPPAGTRGQLKFSFGSCIMRQFPEFWTPIEGFRRIASRKPDMFLLIGDQIYGDLPILAPLSDYPAKWRDAIADPAYQELANQVPVFHMYDDHEVVDNWDNGDNGIYPEAMKMWNIYAGSHNPDPVAPGVNYFTIQRGDVAFFVMDTRRYRTPSVPARGQPAPDSRTMLGAQQLQHLYSWMDSVATTSTWKFLVSTVPWSLNTEDNDSWFGYQVERDAIIDAVAARNMTGTILLSADAHWSAVNRVRKGLYEFVLSPIGAFSALSNVRGKLEPELAFIYGTSFISDVTVDTSVADPTLNLKIFPAKTKEGPLYELNLRLSETVPS